MVNKRGVCIAVGVLLVLTAPLVGADAPQELSLAPDAGLAPDADQAQQEVQKQLDDAAQDAQDASREVYRTPSNAKDAIGSAKRTVLRAVSDLVGTVGETKDALAQTVDRAQSTLTRLVSNVAHLLSKLLDPGTPFGVGASRSLSQGPVQAQSVSADSVQSPVAASFVMVVAASAAGGLLLWATVLHRVVMFSLVPLLSRIAHSEIYTNEARRLIAEHALQSPGVCLNEIVTKTGYSRNAVSYHLFVLEKEGEVVSIKDGKYRRYFPRSGKYVNGAKNVVSVLRNATTLRMAQHVAAHPGTIQRELCGLLGTSASAACWHAKRLEELHVIRKERVANTVQYFPGDALAKYDLAEFGLPRPDASLLAPLVQPMPVAALLPPAA